MTTASPLRAATRAAGQVPATLAAAIERDLTYLARALEALNRRRAWPLERAHYLLLNQLASVGARTVGALADRLALDASTVTRQVAQLEGDGLVRKRPNREDGRSCLVSATRKGIDAARAMRESRLAGVCELLRGWREDEIAGLATSLANLNAALARTLAASMGGDGTP